MPRPAYGKEVWRIGQVVLGVFGLVSAVGWHPEDSTFLHPVLTVTGDAVAYHNPCGMVGAQLADAMLSVTGFGAVGFLYLPVMGVLGLAGRKLPSMGKRVMLVWLVVVTMSLLHLGMPTYETLPEGAGGIVGRVVAEALVSVVAEVGSWILLISSFFVGLSVMFRWSWSELAGRLVRSVEEAGPALADGSRQIAQKAIERSAEAGRQAVVSGAKVSARSGSAVVRGVGGGVRGFFGRLWDAIFVHEDEGGALSDSVWDEHTDVVTGQATDGGFLRKVGSVIGTSPNVTRVQLHDDVPSPTEFHVTRDQTKVSLHPQPTAAEPSEVLDLFPDDEPARSRRRDRKTSSRTERKTRRDAPAPLPPPEVTGLTQAESTEAAEALTGPIHDPSMYGLGQFTTPPASAFEAPARPTTQVERAPSVVEPASEVRPRTSVEVARAVRPAPSVVEPAAAAPMSVPMPTAAPGARAATGAPAPAIEKVEGLEDVVKDDGRAIVKTKRSQFRLPALRLLDDVPPQQATIDEEDLADLAMTVEESLASFKVTGRVVNVRVGPVVTIFEYLPDAGIQVRRINNLADDLAMSLRARSVRVVAPIPGKGVVGIEIPSQLRMTIYFRELLASDEFRKAKMALPVVIGKDVEGRPEVADLAKMPHVLVGGTTGAGKSVGVNGMLMSLLYTRTPDQLRLLLIDPKKLEFEAYSDIPHLLHPVVTEPKGAASALNWACREMDRRYELLARWKTRNIASFNEKVKREAKSWSAEKARKYAPKGFKEGDKLPDPELLPYIVIVIDELADLMMVAKKEVQDSIVRLAQMARACGMHLIIATQRPSVDVVTGLIKSNMPTRIAFKLRSVVDSRTILDQGGAEKLLGRGDMLMLPAAGEVRRCHGAFVDDDEVCRVADFLRAQGEPDYMVGVMDDPSESDDAVDDADRDDLYDAAVEVVVRAGKASTSMVQRHLKIGYNRAARILDAMEAAGVVGPADGARPREVLVSSND